MLKFTLELGQKKPRKKCKDKVEAALKKKWQKLAKLVFKGIIAIKLFALIAFSFCFESIICVNVRFLLVLIVNIIIIIRKSRQ